MRGKRKMPLHKRLFSGRVKVRGGSHKALATFSGVLGLIMMFIGMVGFVSPAQATGGGNEDCPPGTTQLAKYNWNGNSYVAESGGGIVSVSGNATSGTFTVAAGYEVSAVVVKGSNNAKINTYNPPVTSGSFNNSGLINNGGQTADISNLKFCGQKLPDDPEGNLNVSSDCESITFSASGVKPDDAEVVFKLDGNVTAPGTHAVNPGSHTVDLYVDGVKVDSETVKVKECEEEDKVSICHATSAVANPYNILSVPVSAVDGIAGNSGGQPDHYGEHQGPIFNPAIHENGDNWGDIIPPVPPHHAGLNWTSEGQAIYNNGCNLPEEPPTEVPVPTQETVDPCNPQGVTYNVAWKDPLPADTADVNWTESNNGATRTATLIGNAPWSDGTTEPKVFNLPADSGEKCPVEPQCPDGSNPGDLNGDGEANAEDCGYLPPAEVLAPDGSIRVDCKGVGYAFADNSESTEAFGFEVVVNNQATLYSLDAGETRNIRFAGAKPGSVVILQDGEANELDSARVPTSCGSDTPQPNTPTTADTGLWSESGQHEASSRSELISLGGALLLMSGFFFLYGARRRGQES